MYAYYIIKLDREKNICINTYICILMTYTTYTVYIYVFFFFKCIANRQL